jgi:hypothetical protein
MKCAVAVATRNTLTINTLLASAGTRDTSQSNKTSRFMPWKLCAPMRRGTGISRTNPLARQHRFPENRPLRAETNSGIPSHRHPLDPRNTQIYGCKSLFFGFRHFACLGGSIAAFGSLVRVAPSNFGLSRSLKRRFRILAVLESNRHT